ncbi:DUF29 family protein [[Limnothrix rosea] IAM M-220]|uniref:DUF29 family protein n=1 Tax=[Limnothrix rosea] IAM M-220 TaxID=454133 RepID=UPI000A009631|nr:DUF29 family protein [[Limnothrix rosea] IAM M-220]
MTHTPIIPSTAYDQDYQLWLQQTLEKLRLGHYEAVDWENLIGEIESIGKGDRPAIALDDGVNKTIKNWVGVVTEAPTHNPKIRHA